MVIVVTLGGFINGNRCDIGGFINGNRCDIGRLHQW